MIDTELSPTPARGSGFRRALAVGVVAALAIIAVPVIGSLSENDASNADRKQGDQHDADRRIPDGDPMTMVRAAISKTVATGSYDTELSILTTHPVTYSSGQCGPVTASGPGGTCPTESGTRTFVVTGSTTVNFDPLISRYDVNTSVGPLIVYFTSTSVWMSSRSSAPPPIPTPLPNFASSVRSVFGPSQGAFEMIRLANPGGELDLAHEAITTAAAAGTGVVDEIPVRYFDVTIDITKLAETPGLTAEQRATINDALPVLAQAGYTGTTERIGVDDLGYVREITSTQHFTDGSTGERHTILRNFGCAARIAPPGQPTPPPVEPGCSPPIPPTTTTVPSTTTTTLAPASSSTTSTSAPTTSPPASTTLPSITTTVPATTTTSKGP